VELRRTLLLAEEGKSAEVGSWPRFQVTPDNRLFVICYVSGRSAAGEAVSEDRVMEIRPGGDVGAPVKVPLSKPFTDYFTATVRGGSPPSNTIELLGNRAGTPLTMSYARIRLW
jgi:hypothetical protein